MKASTRKTLVASCLEALRRDSPGERYSSILRYFVPEFLAAFVLYVLVTLFDARMIAHLKSTEAYAAMSVTSTLVHFLIKVAEGLSVGTMVLCGYYHGRADREGVVRAALSSLMATVCVGLSVSCALYVWAGAIYQLLGISPELAAVGVPFLRLRAVSIGFMFLFFGLIGFLRGIKRNGHIMRFFVAGSLLFVACDYVLIGGCGPIPALGLQGSAFASVVQYACMTLMALAYIIRLPDVRAHGWSCFKMMSPRLVGEAWMLSVPVIGDKAVLAVTKMMLMARIAHMGTAALSSFGVIRDLEMIAFIPALALAQVVAFLVSNELGAGDTESAKGTIKKTLILAGSMAIILAGVVGWNIHALIGLFDTKHVFTDFAARAFPIVSLFVILDVVQVILAGALRGAAQGRVVLWVRIMSLLLFAAPVMHCAACVDFQSDFVRFVTMYGAYYVGNTLMGIWYVHWFRSGRWQQAGWNGGVS